MRALLAEIICQYDGRCSERAPGPGPGCSACLMSWLRLNSMQCGFQPVGGEEAFNCAAGAGAGFAHQEESGTYKALRCFHPRGWSGGAIAQDHSDVRAWHPLGPHHARFYCITSSWQLSCLQQRT